MMAYSERMSERIRSPIVRQRIDEILMREEESYITLVDNDYMVQAFNELSSNEAIQVLDMYIDTVKNHMFLGGKVEPSQANKYFMQLIQAVRETNLSPPPMSRSRLSFDSQSMSPTFASILVGGDDEAFATYGKSRARISEKITPMIQRMLEEIFCEEEDSRVLEDRSLMQMLSRIPELHAAQALRKYQQTVLQRGRASINNPCGYLISLLKKAQENSREETGHAPQSRSAARPLKSLNPRVRAELEKTFENRSDRSVLDDVGLIKQLGRLEESQAIEAIANYREASNRRNGKSILNPSAYFMVILREYIEGTTPLHTNPITADRSLDSSETGRISSLGGLGSDPAALSPTSDLRFNPKMPALQVRATCCAANEHCSSVSSLQTFSESTASLLGSQFNPPISETPLTTTTSLPSPPYVSTERHGNSPLLLPSRSPIHYSEEGPPLGFLTPTSAPVGVKSPQKSDAIGVVSSPIFTVYSNPLHSPSFIASPERFELKDGYSSDGRGPHTQSPIHMMRQIQRQQRMLAHQQAQQELSQVDESPRHEQPPPTSMFSTTISGAPANHMAISATALAKMNLENASRAYERSQDEVSDLLSKLGLYKYIDKMKEAEVDMEALRLFEERDLMELGIPKGPRIKILHCLHGDTLESGGCGSSITSPTHFGSNRSLSTMPGQSPLRSTSPIEAAASPTEESSQPKGEEDGAEDN